MTKLYYMLYRVFILGLLFSLSFSPLHAQSNNEVLFEDFIEQHEGLDNAAGELVPINIDEIERKIRFYIEEKFPKIVENTDNILWDAYTTFTSHANKMHKHRFIAQVKVRNELELKFIEIEYNPFSNEVEAYVYWSPEELEFKFEEKFLKLEASKADLVELKVANQNEKPNLSRFTSTHQGFIDLREEKNRGQNNSVPLEVNNINQLIVNYVDANFDLVEYTRNVTWNSYSTFISPYSSHHYHTFLAHVKVKDIRQTKYLEVIYNPESNSIETNQSWDREKQKFTGLNLKGYSLEMSQF